MWSNIIEMAQLSRPRIGTGLTAICSTIEQILNEASKYAEIVVMGQDVPPFESEPEATASEAVKALRADRIDGFVLGSFRSEDVNASIRRQFAAQVIRLPLLRFGERYFLMGPLHISGEESLRHRLEMVEKAIYLLRQFSQVPKIGALSWKATYLGDSPSMDRLITETAYLVRHFAQTGVEIRDYTYLVNEAILDDCNLIVAPNGLATNLIGAVLYLGGGTYIAAPALFDRVYIYTSDALQESTYLSAVIFASALANLRQQSTVV